jgi:bacterioferritin-associated ferredoxin
MYVCLCKGLTESDVHGAGRAGIVAPEALLAYLRLDDDSCCGRCARELDRFVELATSVPPAAIVQQPCEGRRMCKPSRV